MFIPAFWGGVLVTIAAEAVLLIVAAVISYGKDQKKK